MWAACIAWITLVGSSFAFPWNEAVQEAVQNNDYQTFQEVAPERLLEKVDSEEAFGDFAAKRLAMASLKETHQAAILEAVQANDFEAFQSAHETMKAAKEAVHGHADRWKGWHWEPTEEQQAHMEAKQLEHFNELVSYYSENGELPENTWHRHGKRWKKWDCEWKWFHGNQAWFGYGWNMQ